MKNTDKEYQIIKKNNNLKKYIAGSAVVTSLFIAAISMAKNNEMERQKGEEEYNYYQSTFIEAVNSIDESSIDVNFDNIWHNGKYIINNKEYSIKQIYISILDNGQVVLTDADQSNINILTNEVFNNKEVKICLFKNSSVFYQMYQNGIITNEDIILDNNTINYISNWDGKRHNGVAELMAESIANEQYEAKYGR